MFSPHALRGIYASSFGQRHTHTNINRLASNMWNEIHFGRWEWYRNKLWPGMTHIERETSPDCYTSTGSPHAKRTSATISLALLGNQPPPRT